MILKKHQRIAFISAIALSTSIFTSVPVEAAAKRVTISVSAKSSEAGTEVRWSYKGGKPKAQSLQVIAPNALLNNAKYKLDSGSRTFLFSNLSPDTRYKFIITTVSPSLRGVVEVMTRANNLVPNPAPSPSATPSASPTPTPSTTPIFTPGIVSGLKVVNGDGKATLSWNASEDRSVTSYKLESRRPNGFWNTLASVNALYYDLSGLTNGEVYYYRVAATNSAGTGIFSSQVTAEPISSTPSPTPTPVAQLGAPSGLNLSKTIDPTKITLNWNPPTYGTAISYRVEYATGSSNFSVLSNNAANPMEITALIPGTFYSFRVLAVNGTVVSAPSNLVSVTTTNTITLPGAPQSLTATATSSVLAALRWSAPLNDGGAPISGYSVEVSADGITWLSYIPSLQGLEVNASGLVSKRSYYFRAAAINSSGTGSWSNIAKVTTP